jgi:1,4-alpha-glucan branching enzyme
MTLDPHVIHAVVEGEHGDPFAVLGPHRVQTPEGAAVAVRAILPGAAAVRVLPADAAPSPMERLHPAGFFETVLPDRLDLFAYRLEVTRDGQITEIEDPYRFPSLLSDFERHLLAEGTHCRAHEKLGAHPAVLDGVTGVAFAVWAPSARRVSVVGDFNNWDGSTATAPSVVTVCCSSLRRTESC